MLTNPDTPQGPAADSDLPALYDQYFTVRRATTPALLDEAHVLRYQVYCVENAYEDPALHPDGRETDSFDAHAVHAVLIYRPTGVVGGCVRLILPQASLGLSTLPIRALLGGEARARLDRCDPAQTAEVSRYAVSKAFRRRATDGIYPDVEMADLPSNELRRLVPHVSLGLLRGGFSLAASQHVTTVCAAMAPALLRLLQRLGLEFEPLGPVIDYHGARQPCLANCDALLAGLAAQKSQFYGVLQSTYHGETKEGSDEK